MDEAPTITDGHRDASSDTISGAWQASSTLRDLHVAPSNTARGADTKGEKQNWFLKINAMLSCNKQNLSGQQVAWLVW